MQRQLRIVLFVSLAALCAARGEAFVNIEQSASIATAARWSVTDLVGRGLADGKLSVSIEPGFAEAIALAVTGQVLPQDVADVELATAAAFKEWESPVLHFEVTFDGATTIGASVGAEIDVFETVSSDPNFEVTEAYAVTRMLWSPQANRTLTNGTILAGNTIYGADIFVATDRLAAVAPFFTREQQLRIFQRLIAHEIGHSIGLNHPRDTPWLNLDTDTNPANAILIDPSDPHGNLILSSSIDELAIMNRGIPPDVNALFYITLRNDDRGGRDVLYPALGSTQDICQPVPLTTCAAALKSKLQVTDDPTNDAKDKLQWRWLKGTADLSDFGAPDSGTRYSLCIYQGAIPRLAGELALPAGASWTAVPGKGFHYEDAGSLPHGVRTGLLKAGTPNRAKILIKAGGDAMPEGLLPMVTPVVAQLVRADTMGCWTAHYDAADVISESSSEFKAKAQ